MTAKPLLLILAAIAAIIAIGGCPQVDDGSGVLAPGGTGSSSQDVPAVQDEAAAEEDDAVTEDDEDERIRIIAWLQSDVDHDGLTTEIELDYGLDPQDPSDGIDIDGDGILNCEDPDVDGDGIFNGSDSDIDGDGLDNSVDTETDGDAVPDRMDTDDDADGVRDRWDWDDDGDGDDDPNGGSDDDDEDEEEDEKLNEAGGKMAEWVDSVFGQPDPPDSDELKEKYAQMAAWAQATFDDKDPLEEDEPPAGLSESLRRFGATISQLAARGENGDAKVPGEMRALLRALPTDSGTAPVTRSSTETRLVVQTLSDRFLSGDESVGYVGGMVDRLVRSGQLDTDISGALDVLFRQSLEVRNPRGRDALDDLQSRIDGVIHIVDSDQLVGADLATGCNAVSRLAAMPGDGFLEEKVDGLTRVAGMMDDKPELGELVSKLEALAEALDARCPKWDWDDAIDALENAPGIEQGIDSDVIEYVVDQVDDA